MIKKTGYVVVAISIFLGFLILLCNFIISWSVDGKIYSDSVQIPKNKVGLVLGTSKKLVDGKPNAYYTQRINATVTLFKAGKIDFVLVSGDNATQYYNEPHTFKKDLVAKGIPAEKIFLDYAGFRTLDSMVRAKYVFGLERVTVISQKFHLERAIYLAEKKRLPAIGFIADDVTGTEGIKVTLREYLAKVKVFIDLLLNTQPKFYGERIEIK
ncbi:ElyC/SanA/YdcF family protein [Arenibacter sp. GZD96]|uniref:SanA/YdcF family protein n=1 Tax=Aurantibrevibacter litoralis TaxID=3106030 RepID=UPI002AFEDF99|nr:ElyC/SanA/YdcF family protein [Arenibacter sp. GZD-96]MEA1784599.1 ElyC/SanA/YdcF family protein [Arenibacter sp. GZD-96]